MVGHLNSFSASGVGNLNKNFPKIQMPGGLPRGGCLSFNLTDTLRVRSEVFIAIVVVGLSGGRFSDQKGCCLSSKTREKNVCRGRMIELSTEMARVAEVDRGNFVVGKGKHGDRSALITRVFTRVPSRLTAVKPEVAILGADQKERGFCGRG